MKGGDKLNVDDIMLIIGNYAFPIGVSMWLLYERSKTMKEFTMSLQHVSELLESMVKGE